MTDFKIHIIFFLSIILCCALTPEGAAQTPKTPHSVSHQINDSDQLPYGRPYSPNPPSAHLIEEGDDWSYYTNATNSVLSSAIVGNETWLATGFGIKRLDSKTKTMTHYTQLDGLPGKVATRIVADSEGVYCLQNMQKEGRVTVALCSFDRKTALWQNLKEIPIPPKGVASPNQNFDLSLISPFDKSDISLSPERVCVFAGSVRGDSKTRAFSFDRRSKLLHDLPFDDKFRKRFTKLSISWMEVDREGVWFGTNHGLLRWTFEQKKWNSWLADQVIYAGEKAEDGTIWMAGLRTATLNPILPKQVNSGFYDPQFSLDKWRLIQFDPKRQTSKTFTFAHAKTSLEDEPHEALVTALSVRKNRLWMTISINSRYQSTELGEISLEDNRNSWKTILPYDPMRNIPDDVLRRHSQNIVYANTGSSYRFPDWNCPEKSDVQEIVKNLPINNPSERAQEGTFWTTSQNVLYHFTEKRKDLEFDSKNFLIPVHPGFKSTAFLGEDLYVIREEGLYVLEKGAGEWKKIFLSTLDFTQDGIKQLTPLDDTLLISTKQSAVRYFPKLDGFRVESLSYPDEYALLGVDGKILLFVGKENLLYKKNPESHTPERIPVKELPAGLLKKGYKDPSPIAFFEGLVWFRSNSLRISESVVIGYDLRTGTWTPEQLIGSKAGVRCSFTAYQGLIFATIQSDNIAIRCYDPEKRRWKESVPLAQEPGSMNGRILISVNGSEAWLYFEGDSIQRYNRQKRSWERFPMPDQRPPSDFKGRLQIKNNEFLLDAPEGIWAFNKETLLWKRQPLPSFLEACSNLGVWLSDKDSGANEVWLTAPLKNSRENVGTNNFRLAQSIPIRFDIATKTWATWTPEDGLDPPNRWLGLTRGGENIWALSEWNNLFKYDERKNKWINVSQLLGSEQKPLKFCRVVADARSLWMQTGILAHTSNYFPLNVFDQNVSEPLNPELNSPLIRYDFKTGEYILLNPMPGRAFNFHTMQVDETEIWLPTNEGLFLYDKMAQTWNKIEPPLETRKFPPFSVSRYVRKGNEFWFLGYGQALRFRKKS